MKNILFLIGSANISGGTYVILQHALYLQNISCNVTLACIEFEELSSLLESDKPWHPGLKQLHFIAIKDINKKRYDLAIFTWWKTIFYLPKLYAKNIVYFIQSIESKFYDPLDTPLCCLVNSTYTLNLPVITEATWIKHYLYKHYGSNAQLVHNGIRKDIYFEKTASLINKNTQKLRILVEGPLGVPFKNTEKTLALCSKIPNIELWWLTSSKISHYKNVDKIFSCLTIEKAAEVYRSCDVLVKLSYVEGMFAPPLEIFHCGGTCIVYDVTGHDEYIKNNYNGIVVKTDDEESVTQAIQLLIQDKNYLNKLKAGALETAKSWLSWEQSSSKFHQCLNNIVHHSIQLNHPMIAKKITIAYKQYELAIKKQPIFYQITYKLRSILKYLIKKHPKLNNLKQIYYLARNKLG